VRKGKEDKMEIYGSSPVFATYPNNADGEAKLLGIPIGGVMNDQRTFCNALVLALLISDGTDHQEMGRTPR